MSGISPVTSSLIAAETARVQTQQDIQTAVARKALDATRAQGDAAIQLLEQASDLSRPGFNANPNVGQHLDVFG